MSTFNKWMLLAVALPAAAFALEPPKETCANIKRNQEFLRARRLLRANASW